MSSAVLPGVRVLPLSEMSAPCRCLDIDVADGVPALPAPTLGGARCAWVLVRWCNEPLGTLVIEIPRRGIAAPDLAGTIRDKFGAEIERRAGVSGSEWGSAAMRVPAGPSEADLVRTRGDSALSGPEITVVICTHDRPEGLATCLQSLMDQDYRRFSVLVVDNAPPNDKSQAVARAFDPRRVVYVVEPIKGLSRARNTALAVATGDVVAWIDDDEIADRHWLSELARGFVEHPGAAAVSGIMLPAELETWPQVRFEQYGGHNKHRGFQPAVFGPESARTQSPLYPLPPYGTGGNMAFRRRDLLDLGGFDVALGAGSPAMGSEDTKVFSQILCRGGTVVYQPRAMTFHFHRRTAAEFEVQMSGYGVGLTAFYTSMVVTCPRLLPELFRLLPLAGRDMLGKQSLRSGHLPYDFPVEASRANRRGLLAGPVRYLKGRFQARRVSGGFGAVHSGSVG